MSRPGHSSVRDLSTAPREALGRLFTITLRAGSTAVVRAFIAKGVALDARDITGQTPLIIAAGRGHVECARLLIEAGCDVRACDDNGADALAHARAAGCDEVVDLIAKVHGGPIALPSPASRDLPPRGADLRVENAPTGGVPPPSAMEPTRDSGMSGAAPTITFGDVAPSGSSRSERTNAIDVPALTSGAERSLEASGVRYRQPVAPVGVDRGTTVVALPSLPTNGAEVAGASSSTCDDDDGADFFSPFTGHSTGHALVQTAQSVGDGSPEPDGGLSTRGFALSAGAPRIHPVAGVDDWIEETAVPTPRQSTSTLIEAAGVQHGISSFRGISLGDDWSETDLTLPSRRVATVERALSEDLIDDARRLITEALLVGTLSPAPYQHCSPEANAADFVLILTQIAGDAGLCWNRADDPWLATAMRGEETGSEFRSEVDDWLEEFCSALADARHRSRTKRVVRSIPRLTREQEDDLFLVSEQAAGEAALQLARSVDAINCILAAVAAVAEGALSFGSLSLLEIAIPDDFDEVDADDLEAGPTDASPAAGAAGKLPTAYESAVHVLRGTRDAMSGGAVAPADIRACSLAIHRMALAPAYLAGLADALSGIEDAAEAVRAVRTALRVVKSAHDRLAEAHLPYVRETARYFKGRGLDEDDLTQEGSIGLLRAVELFEPARGFRFWTYAQLWVRQSMGRAVADKGRTIRIPVHVFERSRRVVAKSVELARMTGFEPTVDELAIALDLPEAEVLKLLRLAHDPIVRGPVLSASLEAPQVSQWFGQELDEVVIAAQLRRAVRDALLQLDARSERVLRMRFGIGLPTDHTLEEVGEQFGLTRERIRQIEAKALGRLFRPQGRRTLRHFRRL